MAADLRWQERLSIHANIASVDLAVTLISLVYLRSKEFGILETTINQGAKTQAELRGYRKKSRFSFLVSISPEENLHLATRRDILLLGFEGCLKNADFAK